MTPQPTLSILRCLPQDDLVQIKVRDLRHLIESEMDLSVRLAESIEHREIELHHDDRQLRVVKS